MDARAAVVKRHVVRLSEDERNQLEAIIRKGKCPAQRQTKARILLKADISKHGEGLSDSAIVKAVQTSLSMVYRVRKQLVEEGFEAVLSRKMRATPTIPKIFDGEKEARLIPNQKGNKAKSTDSHCACNRCTRWPNQNSR